MIAAKRDEALADFRSAADRARELALEFAADKVAAAGQRLREAESAAAEVAHATLLATHATAQAARAVVRAASEALAALDAKTADALEADLARLALLGDGLNANPPFGPAIDPAETGPLGPLWPAGEPVWFRAPQQALAEIPKRTLLAMRLEHIVTALAGLSQALDRMPHGRGPATS